jgi:hypothetical protein
MSGAEQEFLSAFDDHDVESARKALEAVGPEAFDMGLFLAP